MCPFDSANTDSVWASTSRSRVVARTHHGSTVKAGCAKWAGISLIAGREITAAASTADIVADIDQMRRRSLVVPAQDR
jgi:hypothetical protein